MAGYVPILAHVERYHVLREEGRLEELADTGARIQMNYSSIDGGWNNNTAQWCKQTTERWSGPLPGNRYAQ